MGAENENNSNPIEKVIDHIASTAQAIKSFIAHISNDDNNDDIEFLAQEYAEYAGSITYDDEPLENEQTIHNQVLENLGITGINLEEPFKKALNQEEFTNQLIEEVYNQENKLLPQQRL